MVDDDRDSVSIVWDCGTAQVQRLGGMLGPVWFTLPDGRKIQPFAIAPWADDETPEHAALPGIMRRLRGEWPCVPFGAPSAPGGLPESWRGAPVNSVDPEFHGHSSHHVWDVVEQGDDFVVLSIAYPDAHPIRRLTRKISGRPGAATIDCELTIEARKDVTTTIALHPVFRLADEAGQSEIVADFKFGRVLPFDLEPGVSRLTPDAEFTDLNHVPAKTGFLSLQRLPFEFDTEELVQLCHAGSPVRLIDHCEDYEISLQHDRYLFPSVLLWISNRGRTQYPWNGRFTALGVEPLHGAFDLGPDIGAWPENPLAKSGVSTAIKLTAGEILNTSYSISVSGL